MLENPNEEISYCERRRLALDDGSGLCADDIQHHVNNIHASTDSGCTAAGNAEHEPDSELGRWQWQHDGVEENHIWQRRWCRQQQQLDLNDAIPPAAGNIEQLIHNSDNPVKLEFNMSSYKSSIRLLTGAALFGGMSLLAGCGGSPPPATTTTTESTTVPAVPPPPTTTTNTTNTQSTP